jgi:nitrite reductase/ring-hydroxylating ferredoxin subunit
VALAHLLPQVVAAALTNPDLPVVAAYRGGTRARQRVNKGTVKKEREYTRIQLNRKESKEMLRRIMIGALVLTLALIIAGCSGSTSNPPPGPIKATLIEPQVAGDIVSIPVSEVESNRNVRFKVEAQDGDMNFMAYVLDGEIYVRANVCPPCQSIGFSLDEDILVCDRCATRFRAQTGEGISGACVNFPKASVTYEINSGNIVMNSTDLITAYQDTLELGWP